MGWILLGRPRHLGNSRTPDYGRRDGYDGEATSNWGVWVSLSPGDPPAPRQASPRSGQVRSDWTLTQRGMILPVSAPAGVRSAGTEKKSPGAVLTSMNLQTRPGFTSRIVDIRQCRAKSAGCLAAAKQLLISYVGLQLEA